MVSPEIPFSTRQDAERAARIKSGGFALVSCLAFIPLLAAAVLTLAGALHALQRKSLAQAVCVNASSRLSAALGVHLTALMRLNAEARRLRVQRARAEDARRLAVESGNPGALAVAQAQCVAVRLAQVALDVRQRTILAAARITRRRHQVEFRGRASRMGGHRLRTEPRLAPALAVRARPAHELAPEYEEVDGFARHQRQSFAFDVAISPDFARAVIPRAVQRTSCATTLKKWKTRWQNQIVEASAQLNSRW